MSTPTPQGTPDPVAGTRPDLAPAPLVAPAAPAAPVATATSPGGSTPGIPAYRWAPEESDKSFVVTWVLAWLVGSYGVDRFYLGKIGTGVLKLLTLGGLGVWSLVDLVLVLTGSARDAQGRSLTGYAQHRKLAWIVTAAVTGASFALGLAFGVASSIAAFSTATLTSAAQEAADDAPPVDPWPDGTDDAAETETEFATVQEWADATYGSFEATTASGSGPTLVPLPASTAGLVTATYDGDGYFSIATLDATGGMSDLLVNTGGPYAGTTAFGLLSPGAGTTLEVTADAAWTLQIAPVSTAGTLVASGTGDTVMLNDGPEQTMTATHDGELFTVWQDAGFPDLLLSETGPYTGTATFAGGRSVVSVGADGAWTLTPGEG